jgi:NADPH2:quinone reductase
MRAVVLKDFGGIENLHMEEIPTPEPQAGEVRIRVRAAAFNPIDYKYRQGRFDGSLPMVLGFDAAGVVADVGADVSDLAVGDEVYTYLGGPKSNGACAEFVCVPAAFVAKKPERLDFAAAAGIPLAGLTAYQAVHRDNILSAGKSVFVAAGAGGVGSITIQLLRRLGADPILTTAGSDRSSDYLVNTLGVKPEHILRYRGLSLQQMRERTFEMNGGKPVAAAFDYWGGDMKRLCCRIIDFDGRIVSIVEEPPGFDLNVWNASRSPLFSHSATLHFEYVGARAMFGKPETWKVYREQLKIIATMIDGGELEPVACTDVGKFSAEAAQKAHAELETGHVQGKLVMTFD